MRAIQPPQDQAVRGLRPALTRPHGETMNIDHTGKPASSSTRNDEEPNLTGVSLDLHARP